MQIADDAKIRDITGRIVAALAPERVLLFGSYAWGAPHAESDLDLYVVVPDQAEPPYRLARRAYHALRGVKAPVDLVVRTRTESTRNAGVVSTLDCEVLTRGIVLYMCETGLGPRGSGIGKTTLKAQGGQSCPYRGGAVGPYTSGCRFPSLMETFSAARHQP